jgi:Predicted membrane protein (DUF2142)
LVLLAASIAVTLSKAPLVLTGEDQITPAEIVASTRGGSEACQTKETLPAGTTAMRFWIAVNLGPEVKVAALSSAGVITRGRQTAGWTGAVVTIPVQPVRRTVANAEVCFKFGGAIELIGLVGSRTAPREGQIVGIHQASKSHNGNRVDRKMTIEYLGPGNKSWWSHAQSIAENMDIGLTSWGGWIALVPLALMAMATILTARLILRQLGRRRPSAGAPIAGGAQLAAPPEPRPAAGGQKTMRGRRMPSLRVVASTLGRAIGRVPAAARVCACVGFLSAASWSLLTPPFQVPDEPSHFAYVQQLADAYRLPISDGGTFAPQEMAVLEDTEHEEVRFNPVVPYIFPPVQQRRLKYDLAHPLPGVGPGDAGVATSQPPLYYALETIPYYLGSNGTLLDSLELMRLLSAMMAGLTALFALLFLREALPGAPWAWTVGGLGVALAPLLGFMSGAVNPDSMLATVSTVTFYCLARAFRRGLTRRLAIAIGFAIAVGLLTKLNYVGLLPGIGLALILLARRLARASGRAAAIRRLAVAIAIPATPVIVYLVRNLLTHHRTLGLVSSASGLANHHGSLAGEAVYIWEYFLPRLPGMANDFPGMFPLRQIWFDRSVGLYGWLDTYFSTWVYNLALIPAGLIAVLCLRTLISSHAALWGRIGELLSYALMTGGILLLIGADAYIEFPGRSGGYSEPRYFLPMSALFAAVFALAARAGGKRWGPALGTLIVLLLLAHDLFSQLLVVGRYYG